MWAYVSISKWRHCFSTYVFQFNIIIIRCYQVKYKFSSCKKEEI